MRCPAVALLWIVAPTFVFGGRTLDDFRDAELTGWSCRENGSLAHVGADGEAGALRLSFDLSGDTYCWAYRSAPETLPASSFRGYILRYRGDGTDAVVRGVLKVAGRDGVTQFVSADPPLALSDREERSVLLPFSAFPGLTARRDDVIDTFGFVVMAGPESREGRIEVLGIGLAEESDFAVAPVPREPEDAAQLDELPTFRWEAVPGAGQYEITVRRAEPDGEIRRFRAEGLTLATEALPDGAWTWSVAVSGGDYLGGASSVPFRFVLDRFPPRVERAEATPERITVVFDDAPDPQAPFLRAEVAGKPIPARLISLQGRRLILEPDEILPPGDFRLTLRDVRSPSGLIARFVECPFHVPRILPLVADRGESIRKDLFGPDDRDLILREALGFGSEFTSMLRAVPWIANAIDGNTESELFGWQGSHRYRSSPEKHASWDVPSNARIMECIYVPFMAYVLDRPYNPYHHDPVLRDRLVAALTRYLDLQTAEGGFPEYGGYGSNELPSTSFGIEFLIEMWRAGRDDATLPPELRARLFDAVCRAVRWAAAPSAASTGQGAAYTNQYCGALYGMWVLFELTGEEEWKRLYDERLDGWIAAGQELPYWYEADGVETFGYSRITEWELDRIFVKNDDPRIAESLRRYYEWCSLNTVVEYDFRSFIMDNLGHARTGSNGPAGGVGYYNHIAARLPAARAWMHNHTMTEGERETRVGAWLAARPTAGSEFPTAGIRAYNPFAPYMSFEPTGFWTVTEEERLESISRLPFLLRSAFTRYEYSARGDDAFLFARRPGVYASLHWGTPQARQAKEIGLVWVPGFGTLIRSTNAGGDAAYLTRADGSDTYRKIVRADARIDGFEARPEKAGPMAEVQLLWTYEGMDFSKALTISPDGISVAFRAPGGAVEQIPLYLRPDDILALDGVRINVPEAGDEKLLGRVLKITRRCGDNTGQAAIEFERPVQLSGRSGYELAGGRIQVLEATVPFGGSIRWQAGATAP